MPAARCDLIAIELKIVGSPYLEVLSYQFACQRATLHKIRRFDPQRFGEGIRMGDIYTDRIIHPIEVSCRTKLTAHIGYAAYLCTRISVTTLVGTGTVIETIVRHQSLFQSRSLPSGSRRRQW